MMRRSLMFVLCLTFLVAGGCKKKEGEGGGGGGGGGAPACPEQKVTVDGEPFVVQHAVAYKDKMSGTYGILIYNQPGATCEEVLAPSRQVPEGEKSGSVFGGGEGAFGSGVSLESNAELGGNTTLVAKTETVGEPVTICVPEPIEWTASVGAIKGKKVSFVGLFTGPYCGER